MKRLTFLSHFVICLAIAAGAFFAWKSGVPQMIYADDLSRMTSVIAVLFLCAAVWLGQQAWVVDGPNERPDDDDWTPPAYRTRADFGYLAEKLCVMAGLAGTTIGLSLQAKALISGPSSFGALATSLYTTASGVTAAALIAILVFNLEAGIRRARQ